MTDAAVRRLRQGFRALGVWLRPTIDDQIAVETLSPELLALFRRMRPSERLHSLNVYRTLQARNQTHPALLRAALLHDCGKARAPYWLWERSIVVIVKALRPNLAARWGEGEPRGFRRPFVVNRQHPAWGADWVAAAGGDSLTVDLIRAHQITLDHPPANEFEHLLAALQAADDLN